MKDLINYIVEGKYTEADNKLSSVMPDILKVKLFEMKKMVAAKMSVGEMHMNDFSENGADDQKQLPTKSKITKADKIKEQFRAAFSGMSSRQEKLKRDITEEDLEESDLPITTQKQKTDTYRHKKSGREIVATKHPGDEYEKLNEVSDTAKRNYLAAVHHKSGLFRGVKRTSLQGIKTDAETIASAAERSRKNPGKTAYSTQSLEKAQKNLEKKHERRSEIAKKVASSLSESTEEQLDEAPRVKIVKARIRGGVVQRRKKVATVPGMTIRGGQLKRMSPIERRNRKLGARKGKIKRKSKMARALIKRARSLRRRSAIGL